MESEQAMPNTLEFKGDWNKLKGRLKKAYGVLTDNDLAYAEGQEEEMIGHLQKITGRTRAELEKYFHDHSLN